MDAPRIESGRVRMVLATDLEMGAAFLALNNMADERHDQGDLGFCQIAEAASRALSEAQPMMARDGCPVKISLTATEMLIEGLGPLQHDDTQLPEVQAAARNLLERLTC